MHKIVRIGFAVALGFVAGSAVNMGIIMVSGRIIPPPAGADVTTLEGLRASLPLFEPKHFLLPFLAHALGTVAGAFVAALTGHSRSVAPAYAVGGLFLLGGMANVFLLQGPAWFNVVDLVIAYLPAAWLGQTLASSVRRRSGGV